MNNLTAKCSAILLILLFLPGLFSQLAAQAPVVPASTDLATFPLKEWSEIKTGGRSICADSSQYRFFFRKGTVNKLMIWFQGGGACWNDLTCTASLNPMGKGFYNSRIIPAMSERHGVFDLDNKQNPFKDWHVVYLPYCTGDLHLGDFAQVYTAIGGVEVKINHRGAVNVQAALDWVFEAFPTIDKVFVAGKSAGGYGAIFWTKAIKDHFSQSPVFQLSDCSSVVSDSLPPILEKNWHSQLVEDLKMQPTASLLADAYITIGKQYAQGLHLAQVNSMYDGVLVGYTGALEGVYFPKATFVQSWSQKMQEATETIAENLNNFVYFNTDFGQGPDGKTPHTYFHHDNFYKVQENGIRLVDWLRSWLHEEQVESVAPERERN